MARITRTVLFIRVIRVIRVKKLSGALDHHNAYVVRWRRKIASAHLDRFKDLSRRLVVDFTQHLFEMPGEIVFLTSCVIQ